jgi:hypothetical protein
LRFLLRGRTCPGRLPGNSGKANWNPVRRLDISGVQNRTVQFIKPDTPVSTGQRIMEELRENMRNREKYERYRHDPHRN